MSNRLKKCLILILGITVGILIYGNFISMPCIFHKVTSIPCPGCGMTRAFKEILSFNILNSFSYNILAIPLFIFLIFMFISLVYDIVKDGKTLEEKMIGFLERHSIIIIILIIISMIVNIVRGI